MFARRNVLHIVTGSMLALSCGGAAEATQPASAATGEYWIPLLARLAGTYDSECKQVPSGQAGGPILIATDGTFSAPGMSGNVKNGHLSISREIGADGKPVVRMIGRDGNLLLTVAINLEEGSIVRIQRDSNGTSCSAAPKLATISEPNLYATFARTLDITGNIKCAPLSGPRKITTLRYRLDRGVLSVLDQVYDLNAMTAETVTYVTDTAALNYQSFLQDGSSLGLTIKDGKVDRVLASSKDGSGFNC